MDIVDAQIHLGPGRIEETLAQMDALGIRAVVIDELWSFSQEPHHKLPTGGYRPLSPTAEIAAQLHPDRFSYLLRLNPRDPEATALVRLVRDAPGGRALRVDPGSSRARAQAFAEGGYDHVFAAATDANLPIFVWAPEQPEAFARLARKFPRLRIVVDHCGVFNNAMRAMFAPGSEPLGPAQQLALFEQVCALGKFPNVALKWGQSSELFDLPAWPGEGLWPILRRALDAFGPERVMWASDFSVNERGENWADLLYGVKGDPDLTQDEREWVLGRTARRWLDWPV
jgi:predicted TIM-barrel fold metal-dependent hydrolase